MLHMVCCHDTSAVGLACMQLCCRMLALAPQHSIARQLQSPVSTAWLLLGLQRALLPWVLGHTCWVRTGIVVGVIAALVLVAIAAAAWLRRRIRRKDESLLGLPVSRPYLQHSHAVA